MVQSQPDLLTQLELHVYTGLFGSHVAFVMRRLRRLCAAVGNRRNLQFISCTATLPNAEEVFILHANLIDLAHEDDIWFVQCKFDR